jgi:hypothetical protein
MADRGYQLEDKMTNRGEWEFDYTASTLAAAAEAQRDFRKSRVEVWTSKKAEIMEKIKTSGLTVHEGVAAGLSSYSNGPQGGAQVMVDTTLQRDLNECVSKIRTHSDAATDYDGWVQVLRANPESRLKLKHGDWMFFFGK